MKRLPNPLLAASAILAVLGTPAFAANIVRQDWGTTQGGEHIDLYTLTGPKGIEARITNFGGILVGLLVPRLFVANAEFCAGCLSNGQAHGTQANRQPSSGAGGSMTGTAPVKLLLVDDLEENLLALEAILKRDGLTCLKARSGDEALELLLVHDFALALLDVQMPGMDGFHLAEFMRGADRSRQIPIIFLTAGTADLQRRFRGYEAGAVDFIQKPIEPDIIRSKVRVFCELYEQRQQIARQRDELEVFARNLSEADRHKNQFLAILGHELRNPIMALGAGLALLKRRRGEAQKAEDIRTQMEGQIGHLSRLVEDLMDISRIDQGKISLKKERVELGAVLAAAIELSRPLIDNERHTLAADLFAQPVWVDGDFTRLSQIFSNLLNNAAKYTPQGGEIGLSAKIDGAFAEIDVFDNGIGIVPEMQSRIFDLFTQVNDASQSGKTGLGIGLALVKQLVEMHGGTISLQSAGLNAGSTFKVRLPVSR